MRKRMNLEDLAVKMTEMTAYGVSTANCSSMDHLLVMLFR